MDNKAACKILVAVDNFRIGGRETFMHDNLLVLRNHGFIASLVAEKVEDSSKLEIFEHVYCLNNSGQTRPTLNTWIQEAGRILSSTKYDFIWAHHYRVLPAWILSQIHSIPLAVTLHSPIGEDGRFEEAQDALGVTMTLLQKPGPMVVSEEIRSQLINICASHCQAHLTPNKVIVPKAVADCRRNSDNKNLSCVFFSRQQKLDHIRAAVLLFHAIKKREPASSLSLYTGITLDNGILISEFQKRATLAKLLGRKWLIKNPFIFTDFSAINLYPLALDTAQIIEKSDIVLGMGRVVLEGLAYKKPCVLIGYEEPVTLITNSNFKTLQSTNFSGRAIKPDELSKIVDQVITQLRGSNLEPAVASHFFDIEYGDPAVVNFLHNEVFEKPLSEEKYSLATNLDALARGSIGEREFIKKLLDQLKPDGETIYKSLKAGF